MRKIERRNGVETMKNIANQTVNEVCHLVYLYVVVVNLGRTCILSVPRCQIAAHGELSTVVAMAIRSLSSEVLTQRHVCLSFAQI
jgi:hypothetical protein